MKIMICVFFILSITKFCTAQQMNVTTRITEAEVITAQKTWGDAIVNIGRLFAEQKDYMSFAAKVVDSLYGFDEGIVLFKPTKACEKQFRTNEDEAVSYFVTGCINEDHGFAIQPWTNVRFENSGILIDDNSAAAMGNYYFTDAGTGKETKVEFTFGYFKNKNGNLLINLHHSSIPYNPVH